MELANTEISVLRGTELDSFGDETDTDTPFIEHVPAILVETGRNTQDPSSPTPRTIRQITCTVPEWLGVLTTDRIRDERSREVYMVITVTRPPDMFGPPPGLTLALKKVTAAGPA